MADLLKPSPITSRATTWIFHCQKSRCCKSCNQTILVKSLSGWTVAVPVQWLWLVASCYAIRVATDRIQLQ
jgi:hypothetical protein